MHTQKDLYLVSRHARLMALVVTWFSQPPYMVCHEALLSRAVSMVPQIAGVEPWQLLL
jgi:hypothetical protein